MPWTLNPIVVGNSILNSTFSNSPQGAYLVDSCMPFAGNIPLSPSVTTGVTALCAGVISLSGVFYVPSNGVTSIASPLTFTPNKTNTLSFIRLYANTQPVADISCSLSPSDNSAVASTLTIVSGTQFSVTDLRMKMNTSGDVSVNPAVANDFLFKMTGRTPLYGYAPYFFDNYDPATGTGNRPVTAKLYSGSIPARADLIPTGSELWTYALPGLGSMFAQSGLGISLRVNLVANAIASGVPTYCRIRKAGFTSSGVTYPEAIIQVPVATNGQGCTLSSPTFTSGQSYSITGLTLTL